MRAPPGVLEPAPRSWLFVPGNSRRYIAKAAECDADALLLDLEDGVPPADKAMARAIIAEYLAEPSQRVRFVRVNALHTEMLQHDLDAVVQHNLDGICLPKVDTASDVRLLADHLTELERARGLPAGATRVLAAIETARGLLGAPYIAAADSRVVGLLFGAEDFALDLGLVANRTDEAAHLTYARSMIVVAAVAAGRQAVDGVYPHLKDDAGLQADTRRSRDLGFSGKSAFSPRQLPTIHAIFHPAAAEIEFSRRVIAAFETAAAESAASTVVDGQLVDLPIVLRARRVLERSGLA